VTGTTDEQVGYQTILLAPRTDVVEWVFGLTTGPQSDFGVFFDDLSVAAIPEPGSLAAATAGLAGALLVRRRRRSLTA
jgi:hypothetical protein